VCVYVYVSLKIRFLIKIASFPELFPSLFESRKRERERERERKWFQAKFINALGRWKTITPSLLPANVQIGIPKPRNGNCHGKHGYVVAASVTSNFRKLFSCNGAFFFKLFGILAKGGEDCFPLFAEKSSYSVMALPRFFRLFLPRKASASFSRYGR